MPLLTQQNRCLIYTTAHTYPPVCFSLIAVCRLVSRQEGCTCLYWSAQSGHLNVVQLLLESQADANLANQVPIFQPTHVSLPHQPQNIRGAHLFNIHATCSWQLPVQVALCGWDISILVALAMTCHVWHPPPSPCRCDSKVTIPVDPLPSLAQLRVIIWISAVLPHR